MRMRFWTLAAAVFAAATLSYPRAAGFPDDDKTIVHVLNRIGLGARPGDIERVRQAGLRKYIEDQLHPDHIADAGMNARLGQFETLGLSSGEISRRYELPLLEARRERKQQPGDA